MDYKLKLHHLRQSCVLNRTPQDARGFLSARITSNFPDSDFVFIAENDAEMELIKTQVNFFAPHLEIVDLYAWDCLPYDRTSPKQLILSNRIKTFYQLVNRKEGQKFFIITSVNSILQKTLPPLIIKGLGVCIKTGNQISLKQIADILVNKGYVRESCANNVGEFAVRGGIVDIVVDSKLYQATSDLIGYRVDFFGDEIESIRIFDPITQITQEEVKSLEILPTSEVIFSKKTIENFRKNYRENFGSSINDQLYTSISEGRTYPGMEHWLPFFYEENLRNFFDYLQNPVAFFDEKIFQLAEERNKIIHEYYQARLDETGFNAKGNAYGNAQGGDGVTYNAIHPSSLYLTPDELKESLEQIVTIEFKKFDAEEEKNQRILDLEIKPIPEFYLAGRPNSKDPLELMNEFILANSDKKNSQTLIACLTEGFKDRIKKTFLEYGTSCEEIKNFTEISSINSHKAAICLLPTSLGFYTSDLMVIGEQAIFGEKIARKKIGNKKAAERILEEGLSIGLGELVVHRDHGIGKFDGIHLISAGGIKTDMLRIIYGGNDTLFVPVDDINFISRYGADNALIQLDRLGVAGWKNRKEKVKNKIKLAAEELLKIAAARHLKKAPILVPEQHLYDEFKARFNFIETDDQLKTIEEVEEDLRKGLPMDRLVCGDVGFGKTEVAMRAAAIAVFSAKNFAVKNEDNILELATCDSQLTTLSQVAIVTPTTLLSRQHYKNFTTRFEGTGIRIKQLSRLVSVAEAKKIREDLELGKIDIVIGTHALLQKNIKFKNLVLTIVDEEQHFGVAQKERLKELRHEVHILTLSATPIPRTLQMSMTGVKDLSLIATPPLDRIAVRNFMMPYDSVIVREAVMREYNRSGRVFFVVPRIRDIEEMEPRLKILLPEIKIKHAHGQMSPTELDSIMNDFADGKIDMLLSTSIIESGIDISEANTIIIYKPEMFGLAQLYQLRGRVGRGKIRAYSYFMHDNRKRLSKESEKKLEVMQNLDSLGIGFSVANHDMDIRGSGNLLGDEQSGHVKETGVELYQQMLLETIEQLKNASLSLRNERATSHLNMRDDDLGIPNGESLVKTDFSVTIKLGISLLIPEEYMADLALRMNFYKKIAAIKSEEEEENFVFEMTNRFGKIPEEILNLIKIARLKWECKNLSIERLEAVAEGILVSFRDNKFSNPEGLMQMIFASKNQIKIQSGQKLLFICKTESQEQKFSSVKQVLFKLNEVSANNK